CQRDLHRSRPEGGRSRVEFCRLQRREPSEREVGHIGNALCGKIVDELIVAALREVVEVLDTDNLRDCPRLGQLLGRDCAEADLLNEALLLEFSERGDGLFEWLVFRRGESTEPEIHDVKGIEAQVAQIVMYGIDNLLAGACVQTGTIGAAAPADFGDDHQIIGVRMQRLLNDLIGDMRTVEIAGVDVVHARCDSLAKNRDRTGSIAWRAPNPLVAILSGELHGPITDPVHSQRSARERKAATEAHLFSHFVSLPCSSVRKVQKDSPTSSSLFFHSASALCGSSAYARTPSLIALITTSSATIVPTWQFSQ